MSNATEPSRQSGDRRRRHSGGGRNRNRNDQNQRRDRDHQGQSQGGSNSNRSERSDDSRSPRGRRSRPPVKLSWWQKLLKAIGLYKAPSSPKARSGSETSKSDHAPKSNTRNVRSQGDEPREERRPGRDRNNREDRDGRDNRDKKRQRGGDPSTVESCRVYVGNLSYDVAEQDLQELFKGVGTVRNVEVVYNRSTHRSKGYGFVEMFQREDAVRCVEVFHDQPFMGRNMIVSGAKSKQQEEDEQEDQAGPEIKASDVELAPLPKETPDTEENPKASNES